MKVLITGANGMVARAARAFCESIGDEVIALDRSGLDIADAEMCHSVIAASCPDAILNCAAYTDVDGAETHQAASESANADGPKNLAAAALAANAKFVTISTDYVFDGEKGAFYTETDAPHPLGVYAETKYRGELAAAKANANSIIVRSGWIYGAGGTNFLSVMPRLLSEARAITAIDDSYGTPTYAADLAKRLRELAASNASGIYHVTNSGDGTSYFGFAEEVCRIGGFDPALVKPVSRHDLDRPAPRPAASKLASERLEELKMPPLRDWREALAAFVKGF